jgi:protein O-mannosyl-transferase
MNRRRRPLLTAGIAAALFLLAASVYWPARHNGFYLIDDGLYVITNERVKGGLTWSGVRWAFNSVGYASNWHPLTWLSHMMDIELFGLDPGGHHLTSLLLHAAVSVLLFLALRALTGATWPSAAVAVLHAVHPLRVESVAWVSERKELLSGFFWMAGLLAWAKYVRRPGAGRYSLVAVCHLFGLLSKPMMVTFPLVLLILDWWPLDRLRRTRADLRRTLLEQAPLLLLSVAVSLVTLRAQGNAVVALASITTRARFAIALRALAHYLKTTVWPSGLAAYYPLDTAAGPAAPLAGLALAVALSLLAWRFRRRAPWIAAGWAWFLVSILPVVGLVQTGWQAAADRYTYVPLVGIFIALVWAVVNVTARSPRRLAVLLALAAAAALVPVTRAQIGCWKDSETLLRRTLAVTENNWFAHLHLGKLLTGKGRLAEAEGQLRSALSLYPELPEGHRSIGHVRLQQGRAEEAAENFRRAVSFRPGDAGIWHDLGTALAAAGRHDEASASFRQAIDLEPDNAAHWWGLQGELGLAGHEREARQVIARALERFPEQSEFHTDAGVLAARAGDFEQAEHHLQRALELNPGDENARRNLARLAADPRWLEKRQGAIGR